MIRKRPQIADDIFLRARRDFRTLEAWLKDRSYDLAQYREYNPGAGFPRIRLFNGDLLVGEVVCIMPSLFEEALNFVNIHQRAEAGRAPV